MWKYHLRRGFAAAHAILPPQPAKSLLLLPLLLPLLPTLLLLKPLLLLLTSQMPTSGLAPALTLAQAPAQASALAPAQTLAPAPALAPAQTPALAPAQTPALALGPCFCSAVFCLFGPLRGPQAS